MGSQYLTFTRHNLSYAVQKACLFMYDPRERHLAALKSILGYVQETICLLRSMRKLEAEYRGVANVVAETFWLRKLLRELHSPLFFATLVYCDNVSAVYMSFNPLQRQHTKHIEIDIHSVRDHVAAGHVRILHVPSRYQFADIFTKGLSYVLFDDLNVHPSPAPTTLSFQ
ncbi:ribonuclease H-like domain-containing protein [Tanacetum coccineum]